jgi:hypothetical protein
MRGAREVWVLVVAGVMGLGAQAARGGDQAIEDPTQASARSQAQRAATVPFTVDHNRMIVEVGLVRPDGTIRKAPAWVDTGTQVLIVTEPVARDLGLDLSVLAGKETGESVETPSPAPGLRIGDLPLDTSGIATRVRRGKAIMPGVPAEVHLPASALRQEHVVLDYPARRLTVARPGALRPRGVAVPCRINRTSGLFMIEATIDGEPVALGLDNGSAGTWVSTELTSGWQERHPEWRHVIGALGSANFWGRDFETGGVLMRLPEVTIGPLRVRDVAVLGLGQRLFDWYSRKSAGKVAGFLGGNVLKRFRLEVDFVTEMTYWEAGTEANDHDLDIVGLTVRAEDGGYAVAGVVGVDGAPAVEGVEAGDRLIKVGALEVTGATMGAVVDSLRGHVGTTRTLVVERSDRRVTVQAKVMRFP